MEKSGINNFIVVDDDPINNMICQRIIKSVIPEAIVQTFLEPEQALAFIEAKFWQNNATDSTLFLDINMPTMTGWEFLEAFEKFDAGIKGHLKIYILSSSVDERDKERAASNENVVDYISKPLTKDTINRVYSSM